MVWQVIQECKTPCAMHSADNVPATDTNWISDKWQAARMRIKSEHLSEFLLVIDEIQKIRNWSEIVKQLWDEDTLNCIPLKVVLLGSSRVMLERGLADSLAGRFETIRMPHWSFSEMQEAFGISLEQYIYFGAYPAAVTIINDEERWKEYIRSSIIDATINKDILQDTIIAKPALLRQTMELSSAYSGEIISLSKMIGQLQDAGNTTTLSSYLHLLDNSGLVCGLQKYSNDLLRQRASIPKYQVYNNALKSIYCETTFTMAYSTPKLWGRLYESAIGAHLINNAFTHNMQVFYWREGNDEVDYIVRYQGKIIAIEVKSGHEKNNTGLTKFETLFHPHTRFIVGPEGIPAENFLKTELKTYFEI